MAITWFRRRGSRPQSIDRTEELQSHIDLLAEQLQAMGRTPEEARREARLRFGNSRSIQETLERSQSRTADLVQDVRSGLRSTWRHPGFLVVAALPLALAFTMLGITFSVVDAVLLRPLPYADADRIVQVGERLPDTEPVPWADRTIHADTLAAWMDETETVARFAPYHRPFRTLLVHGERVRVPSAAVGAAFFDILAVPPLYGRYFVPDDELTAASQPAVVLGHRLWRREFGADPDVVGQIVSLDEGTGLVVGIAPPQMRFPARTTELWTVLPQGDNGQATGGDRAIGRLRPDATTAAAATEGTAIARRVWTVTHPSDPERPVEMEVVDLMTAVVGPARQGLVLLGGAALLVFLAASLHSGHLFMVHVQRRRPEFAVRTALGASPWRLVRLVLASVVAVGTLAGATALVMVATGHGLVAAILPADFARIDEVVFTWRTAAAVVTGVLLTSVFSAAVLSWHVLRQSRRTDGVPIAGGPRATMAVRTRAGLALLAGEVAFSCALLIVAGLLVRSFVALATTDSGYRPDGVLTAQVSFPPPMGQGERQDVIQRMLGRLEQLESVTSAGASNALPLEDVKVVFQFQPEGSGTERVRMDFGVVSPGYLESLGVRVVQGRSVTWDDRSTTQPVAIVNQAFMQRYYPGRDAIGLQIPGAGNGRSYTVVGVVDDVRLEGPMYPPQPAFYVSLLQRTQATFFNRVNVVVRVLDNPLALTGALREVVRTTDPRLALADVTTLDRQLSDDVARPRLYASALAMCAALSLTVVVIGLFAALAYTAGQRRREVAVRLAIGSSRAQVVRLLLREAAITVSVGLVLGVVAGGVAGRAMAGLLHGVLPSDPYTLAIAPGLLLVAAGLAALVPVTEVLRTDVARALRSE